MVLAAGVGDRAWWLFIVIPAYAVYLGYTTFMGAKQGMAGLAGPAGEDGAQGQTSGTSKRQAKLEKRGGQRVAYR